MIDEGPTGGWFVDDAGEWYAIDGVDGLDPFLVNLVSPYDHWMFVSSSGALTAGRRSAERALFPYENDDRLHRSAGRSGPVTLVRTPLVPGVWEPFAPHVPVGVVHRTLAKSVEGDRLRFTEHHPELALTFHATWSTSEAHGLVRTCELVLDPAGVALDLDVLDGLVDVLPAGVDPALQQSSSTLVDAYRRSELDAQSGLAVFNLEAAISDLPQAAEAMTANVAWSRGLPDPVVALSERQLRTFRSGGELQPEPLVTGTKGAFLQAATQRLEPGERLRWVVVADVARGHVEVAALRRWLLTEPDPVAAVHSGVALARDELVDLMAEQDACQRSGDRNADVHHFANVLYNSMRGGAFVDDHRVEVDAVARAIEVRNAGAAARFRDRIGDLRGEVQITELRARVDADPELLRLVNEYLPLTFSRRHGDPSRPWNRFEIVVRSEDGGPVAAYEGNWRDIFQNWEALLHSFPDYLESAVSKFLSASTRDGHNPYRIDHEGIAWEVPTDDRWGNFGYWGDHQIVYLHRLLDALRRFHPGVLEQGLGRRAYAYADVPYRIKPYAAIVVDSKHTLEFDDEREQEVRRREANVGTDGRLVVGRDGAVHHASLAEKLLVPTLAKVANLVAGGGIWMNTQRPEWNDANNALVGNGLSVVTAFHLRDHLTFLLDLFAAATTDVVPVDPAVHRWMRSTADALNGHSDILAPGTVTPRARRQLMDALGEAYGDYRGEAYVRSPDDPLDVRLDEIVGLLRTCLEHVEGVTSTAGRGDGLVDSYRLLSLGEGTAEVLPLYPMLEGQVALLGSPTVEPKRVLEVTDALFDSEMFRADQGSFTLYPNRQLPPFLERNLVGSELVTPDIDRLVGSDLAILERDVDGRVRFSPRVTNAADLRALLDTFDDVLVDAAARTALLDLHEAVFDHRSFTGRSQSMYRYEGLGSIYWHMVAKLLAAVQLRLLQALDDGADPDTLERLRATHARIRNGLGHRKPVAVHGAFPLDPHSHTPAHVGAQQPGMTGAVKESVLLRLGELGVLVEAGQVRFEPRLLDRSDFLTEKVPWAPLGGDEALGPDTIGFTYCGVPVMYHLDEASTWTHVQGPDLDLRSPGSVVDRETSRLLFTRNGAVTRIDVGVQPPTGRQ